VSPKRIIFIFNPQSVGETSFLENPQS